MSELQSPSALAISEAGLAPESFLVRGTIRYRRVALAMFLCGFGTFSLLYSVQPLMPVFAEHYQITAAASSLCLSLSTAALALSLFPAAAIAERLGRCPTICYALTAAAILHIIGAMVPNWQLFLICRTIEGLFLGGVPAVAMTYLAEETRPSDLGASLGLFISGNAIGGIGGRFISGFVAETLSWNYALGVIGAIGLAMALALYYLLPASRNFRRSPAHGLSHHLLTWLTLLKNRRVVALILIGFLNMGGFVTVYNYTGFRLTAPPFNLGTTDIGLFFTVYLFGIVASWASGRYGGRTEAVQVKLLKGALMISCAGVVLTCSATLPMIALGTAAVTVGFFVVHSSASALIARSSEHARGHASSLYLHTYYVGSSVGGTLGGLFWTPFGWTGVALYTAFLLISAWLASRWIAAKISISPSTISPSASG